MFTRRYATSELVPVGTDTATIQATARRLAAEARRYGVRGASVSVRIRLAREYLDWDQWRISAVSAMR